MPYATEAHGITVLHGLVGVQRKPAMYIGEPTVEKLVAFVLRGIAEGTASAKSVRLFVWQGGDLSVAYDGIPLPIESRPPRRSLDVPQPEIYRLFLELGRPEDPLGLSGPIVNALSEQLLVCTLIDGQCYSAEFCHGTLTGLLHGTTRTSLGSSWLTFRPDKSLLSGPLDMEGARRLAAASSTPAVLVEALDRTNEPADW